MLFVNSRWTSSSDGRLSRKRFIVRLCKWAGDARDARDEMPMRAGLRGEGELNEKEEVEDEEVVDEGDVHSSESDRLRLRTILKRGGGKVYRVVTMIDDEFEADRDMPRLLDFEK